MRSAIQKKLSQISDIESVDTSTDQQKQLVVDYMLVNEVILDIYESKVVKIVRKLPRSHLVLLSELCKFYRSKNGFAMVDLWLNETQLLHLYNYKASRLMIDKISSGELSDIVQTLSNSDILIVQVGNKGNLARARFSGTGKMMKTFQVSCKCELEEIETALVQSQYAESLD